MSESDFVAFRKIPRLFRDIVITEKIDGTNAQVVIERDPHSNGDGEAADNGGLCVYDQWTLEFYSVRAGSRTRWITPEKDNHGFARWVYENARGLVAELGEGRHFGEWWGQGIQRKYGMAEKVFSLFNVSKWAEAPLSLCRVVPVLYSGPFLESAVYDSLQLLRGTGSRAAPGFMNPEGIVVYHTAGSVLFKATIENDDKPKGDV